MSFRTTTPFTRQNEFIAMTPEHWQVLNRHQQHLAPTRHATIQGEGNDQATRFIAEFLKRGLVYLITETMGDYPYPYVTEKTWKAMCTGVPFMIIGARGTLSLLHSFGFRTFHDYWDEDYDSLPTVADRIKAVTAELERLSKLPMAELKELGVAMQAVTNYNKSHMHKFRQQQLAEIERALKE